MTLRCSLCLRIQQRWWLGRGGLLFALMGWLWLAAGEAHGLPPGRAWIPAADLSYPGVDALLGPEARTDSLGMPYVIAEAWYAAHPHDDRWALLHWRDTTWADAVVPDIHASFGPDHVVGFRNRPYLLWQDFNGLTGEGFLIFSEFLPDRLAPLDTAMVNVNGQGSEDAGAIAWRRRWVMRIQQRPQPDVTFAVNVSYSDTAHVWRPLPQLGIDEFTGSLAPLSDSSAMLAYAGRSGLAWARVEGNRWVASGTLNPRPWRPAHPRFALRPSGGLWLTWTEPDRVRVFSYKDGVWTDEATITAVHPQGGTYVAAWIDISQEGNERPLIAWGDLGYGPGGQDLGCIAVPTEDGWAPGEEIPGADRQFTTPHVTRDRYGDIWAAWQVFREGQSRYTHTYCSATAGRPVVRGSGRHRAVSWTLSAPAPGSWWSVLRSRDGGPYATVAQLEAGNTAAMSWTDGTPPMGQLAYRIRRESVDKRYEWLSEEARWPVKSRKPLQLVSSALHADEEVELELRGVSTESVEVQLFDLQGRQVLGEQRQAGGTGAYSFRLGLRAARGQLSAGVYFLRVVDEAGNTSNTVKLVLLK